jgi:hypothetical protein
MKEWFSVWMLVALAFGSHGQILTDSIALHERKFIGYRIQQGPMTVRHERIKLMMKDCPEALHTYTYGKRFESFGMLFTAVGVVLTGATLGNNYFNGSEPIPSAILIPSVAMIGVGIPLYFSGEKRVKLSTALYNQRCLKR